MDIYSNPGRSIWESICSRPSQADPVIMQRVSDIIDRVKDNGDKALLEMCREFDKVELDSIKITGNEIADACTAVSDSVKQAIAKAAANIRAFHQAQLPKTIEVETMPGVRCIQKPVPVGKVGLYIPGGTAPLFSTVLMLAIPASLAGCSKTVLCTPCGKNGKVAPEVLYAAHFCGISEIFKIGGSQAVAAMAYGTESVPKVDKIFGPGNRYVTAAKQLVSTSNTAIDMPAGPSEVMVIADADSNPAFVAADLLSQAEHGSDSQVMLVCTDPSLPEKVMKEIDRQTLALDRGEFIASSLKKSSCVIFDDMADVIDFANCYAPEHLIVCCNNPWKVTERITCAGSVFVGPYTPESAGDYASGTNHTLPTCAWARSYSGVNIDSFMRKMTIQEISKDGLESLAGTITTMAEAEGLQAHANAVKVRTASVVPENDTNTKTLVRENISRLCPYSTARDEFSGNIGVFLDANESPFSNGFNRYPDPHQAKLKARLSQIKGVPVENIFLGNGSDEAIDLVYRVFCTPGKDNAVMITPSYGMYSVCADINDIEVKSVSLEPDFSLNEEKLLNAVDCNTKVIFLCSPNNPSGNALPEAMLEDILKKFSGIVVIDEAYADFSTRGTFSKRVNDYPNLIVLQTLSKAWGLAGLRLGLAFANAEIIKLMSMVKYPYNINQATINEVLKALEQPVDEKIRKTIAERGRVAKELFKFSCIKTIYPSDANFLLVKVDDADALYDHYLEDGIIVRNRTKVHGCKDCLRITIGLKEENDKLIKSTSRYEESNIRG